MHTPSRRDLLRLGALAGAGALAGCGNKYLDSTVVLEPEAAHGAQAVGSGARHRWQLDVAVPHTFPIWAEGVDRFAATCLHLSQGRLEITVRGQGQGAVGTNAIFEAVRDGDIAAGHAAAYYWYGTAGDALKPAVYFTTVPFGMTAAGTYAWLQEGGGQQLWDELYQPFGVKALALGSTGVQAGGWFRKPIATIADLQGLTMRIPGLGGEVLRRAGGNAQQLAPGDIYLALERGRIDATEWIGPYHDDLRGFGAVAPYYYLGGWHEPGSILELLINLHRWDELGDGLQDVVRVAAAEADRWMGSRWAAADALAYQKLKADPSLHLAPYPVALARELRAIADLVKAEIAASSPIAGRISASYAAFQALQLAYHRVAEANYLAALADGA